MSCYPTYELLLHVVEVERVLRQELRVGRLDLRELQALLDDEFVLQVLDPLQQFLVLRHALLQFRVYGLLQAGLQGLVLVLLLLQQQLLALLQLVDELLLPHDLLLVLPLLDILLQVFGAGVVFLLNELLQLKPVVQQAGRVLRRRDLDLGYFLVQPLALGLVLLQQVPLYLLAVVRQLVDDVLPLVVELVDLLVVEAL